MRGVQQTFGRAMLAVIFSLPMQLLAQGSPDASRAWDHRSRAVVIDSVELRGGSGPLVGFLAGRVPGLIVNVSSGLSTATPRAQAIGTSGSVARPDPLLYIDGVLIRDDPHWLEDVRVPQAPSLGWGLPVEEIEEIRVFLGAAGGADLEFGAARGAVYVTTRRPGSGVARVLASVQATQHTVEPDERFNEGTFGTTTGDPTNLCTLAAAAAGSCTPTGRVRWSPLAELAPYRTAQGLRAALSATGTVPWVRFRASLVEDRLDGVLPSSRVHRTDLGLSLSREHGERLRIAGNVRLARLTHPRNAWDGGDLEQSSIFYGPEATDSLRDDYRSRMEFLADQGDVTTNRLTLGGAATWAVRPTTEVRFHLSTDVADRDFRSVRTVVVAGLIEPVTFTSTQALDMSTLRAGAEAVGLLVVAPSLSLRSRAALAWSRTAFEEVGRLSSDFGGSSQTEIDVNMELRSLSVGTRLFIGDRGAIGVGLRKEQLRGGAPAPALPSADATWDLVSASGERKWVLSRLTAFAAYDESVDRRTQFASLGSLFIAPIERTRTREAGIEASLFWRIETGVTLRRADVTDGTLATSLASPPASAPLTGVSWRSDATLWRVGARSPIEARTRWHGEFTAADIAPTRLTRFPALPFFVSSGIQGAPLAYYASDRPLHEYFVPGYTYDDANLDGVIVPSEVTVGDYVRLGTTDPRWILGLRGGLELTSGLAIGALLESRRGHVAVDMVEARRCLDSLCRALHEPGTSLEKQAAAIAMDAYSLPTGFIHDASFTRLREIYIEVALPARLAFPALGRARLRLIGHNLVTWTRFPSLDPEAISRFGAVSDGIAGFNQPIARTVSLRVDLGR
jgi:hypothetical protein